MKISVRQICFIMFAYTAATKLLLFPTVLSLDCGRDLLLPALINFVICGIVVWSLSYLSSRTEKTFFQLYTNIGASAYIGEFFACGVNRENKKGQKNRKRWKSSCSLRLF